MKPARLVVPSRASVARGRGFVLVTGASGGGGVELEGASGELAWEVLSFLREPHDSNEVVDHVRALAEGEFDPRVIEDLIEVLRRAGALDPVPADVGQGRERAGLHAVVAVSGAISAVEAPRAVAALQSLGFEVRVALTETAKRFVSETALSAITHRPVVSSLWNGPPEAPVAHLELARWADVVIVYPASATTIARLASGDFSDVVAAVALSTDAPVLVAPSMNPAMLGASAVTRNLETLSTDGMWIVAPGFGAEVADRPLSRRPLIGSAPLPEAIAGLAALVVERHPRPPRASVDDGPEWERLYRELGAEELPWETGAMPDDLRALLAKTPPPASLLDVGAGLATLAIEAARMGYRVVATDRSWEALRRASAREGAGAVTFVHDDVRESSLAGAFDIVIDRGCLHTLGSADLGRCAASLRRLVAPRGRAIIVHDSALASNSRRTTRLTPEELSQVLEMPLHTSARTTIFASDPGTSWLSVFVRS